MRSSLLVASIFLLFSGASAREAYAQVTKPFTGVTLVQHGGRALAIADLCAPGVSIRATKYAERNHTPEDWANLPTVSASVAVNADFFDFPAASKVNGRARGAGEDWPSATQMVSSEVRSYWQFGPALAALVQPSTTAPAAGVTDIVGAHNVIIRNGKSLAPGFDGDGVILGAFRRTGIGVNAARSKVYLFSSNDALSGADMASTMLAYATEGGAADLDAASNQDGGGSAQMFVRGQGQIVTSGRLVANHLGIVAKGSGPALMCPNRPPTGFLDSADCEKLAGWSDDPDEPAKAVDVRFSFDAVLGTPNVRSYDAGPARGTRADLCKPLGSCDHGFIAGTPFGLFDAKEHTVFAYGVDTTGGPDSELASSRKKITCPAAPPKSVKRHIADAATFAAFRFDAFVDVLPLADSVIAGMTEGAPVTGAPVLVQADDKSPEVWLVDGTTRHHVPDPSTARAWRLDLTKTVTRSAAEVHALAEGVPLRARPYLAKGSAPAIYMLEAPPSHTADGGVDPTAEVGPSGKGAEGSGGASGGDAPPADGAGGCATVSTRGDSTTSVLVVAFAAMLCGWVSRRRKR